MRYSGRDFTSAEIEWIKEQISSDPKLNRQRLSKHFCQTFSWFKLDGGLKDMSCRVAFLRMEKDGHIVLPAPQKPYNKPGQQIKRTLFTEPCPEVRKKAGVFDLTFEIVDASCTRLWNEYIDRNHYLGYTALPRAQLRYFVLDEGDVIALLGFGAAAWKTAPRDDYIGWRPERREKNLHLVVNNARFLILPWIRSPNLASRILSMAGKRIASDWEDRYRYRPVLLETFVQKDRFHGTCYKATNWTYVGDTQGRGKLDRTHRHAKPVKSIWLFALDKSFRRKLCT